MPRRRKSNGTSTPEQDADEPARMDEFVAAIRPLAEGLQALHAQALAIHTPEVDAIIASRCRDVRRIEQTLDYVLSFCGDDAMLALFKRLCRYYWNIDPHATAEYVYVYRDMFDDSAEADASRARTGTRM